MSKVKEIWKDIEGHEKTYQVSNIGRVRSKDKIKRNGNGNWLHRGMIRKLGLNEFGYYVCSISIGGSRMKLAKVHRLVAIAFVPRVPGKNDINHKNGIKTDNRPSNLEWCTRAENTKHAWSTGLIKPSYGENCHKAKLSEKEVLKIRRITKKFSQRELAKMFNISRRNIRAILFRESWRHI